jgi:pimeloyl-ACP methyl ester carboxylesterase
MHSRRTAAALLTAVAAWGAWAGPADARGAPVRCRTYSLGGEVPVAMSTTGGAIPYRVVGELCATRRERARGAAVQLLIHGATYNHSYWDFGTVDGIRYSYARRVAAAGDATFAVDQLGAGQSSKPPSAALTNLAEAYVDHRIVQGLRDGSLTGSRFATVIVVGHSLGSLTVWQEAIAFHDVDGVVITGMAHHFTLAGQQDSAADFHPAGSDPKFASEPWAVADPGYVTTVPGTRAGFFYDARYADPRVIAADDNEIPFTSETFRSERGKDVASRGASDGVALIYSTATRAIGVPVLVVLGSEDAVVCGTDAFGASFDCGSGASIAREEAPYYSPRAHLVACSVPRSGHDIALHLDHALEEQAVMAWSERFFGRGRSSQRRALPATCGAA